jgi:hypothetical protein
MAQVNNQNLLSLQNNSKSSTNNTNIIYWEWYDYDNMYWTQFNYISSLIIELAYSSNESFIKIDLCESIKLTGTSLIDFKTMLLTIFSESQHYYAKIRRIINNEQESTPVRWVYYLNDGRKFFTFHNVIAKKIEEAYQKYECLNVTLEIGDQSTLAQLDTYLLEIKDIATHKTLGYVKRLKDMFEQPTKIICSIRPKKLNYFELKNIKKNSKCWNDITTTMKLSGFLPDNITSIKKIINDHLLKMYECHKVIMGSKKRRVKELQLFHGTSFKASKEIIEFGFDKRYNIRGLFGNGNYFAVSSQMAHKYTSIYKEERIMFLANVLVGDYTISPGQKTITPPMKKDTTQLYDTVVDKEPPSIFVTFERAQSYPLFLISYKM